MDFVDCYEALQISPNAEPETIHRVFRLLALRYHPDNPETGDAARFLHLKQAYEVLKDPERRCAYDQIYAQQKDQPLAVFGLKDFTEGTEGENNRRMGVLCLLYHQRRVDPEEPGLSVLQLENLMAFPREHLRFTLWFLQEKKHIRFNEKSEYEITGEGTEYVESHSPKHEYLQKLLNSPHDIPPEPVRASGEPVSAGPVDWNPGIEHPRPGSWARPDSSAQEQSASWQNARPPRHRSV
jgi:curved DNA-binding protein CbpA